MKLLFFLPDVVGIRVGGGVRNFTLSPIIVALKNLKEY